MSLFSNIAPVDLIIILVQFLITFNIGLTLEVEDYKRVFKAPRSYFTGVFLQIIFLPLLVICLVYPLDIPGEWKVGFLILSGCPGGVTSNLLTYLLKGDSSLSISLTGTSSLITLFTVPLLLSLGSTWFMNGETVLDMPYWELLLNLSFVSIFPAILGLLVRQIPRLDLANYTDKVKYIVLGLSAAMFLGKMFADEDSGGISFTLQEVLSLAGIGLAMNLTGMTVGWISGKITSKRIAVRRTLSLEVGLQNTTLAFFLAAVLIGNPDMFKPAFVYSLFSFWTGILFVLGIGWKNRQER